MRIPNLTLAYQVAELKPLVGGSVLRKVQELPNSWLKLRLQTRQGSRDLVIAANAFFIASFSMPARQHTSGYGAFLGKHLKNKRILSLEQHGFDRVAVLEFQQHLLVLELFAKGNVVLVDKGKKILAASRKEQWKDRELRKGASYIFPASRGMSPADMSPQSLEQVFQGSKTGVVRELVGSVNIAPAFAEAAVLEAGLGLEKPALSLTKKEVSLLCSKVKSLYSVSLEKEQPLLVERGEKKELLPFPLKIPNAIELQRFPSVNQGVDSFYASRFAEASAPEREGGEGESRRLQRSLERQRSAVSGLKEAVELNRGKGEALYKNYSKVFELMEALKGGGGRGKKPKRSYV